MTAEHALDLRGPIVAILKVDDLRRRAFRFGEIEKIGIRRYNRKPLGPCVLPDLIVRRGTGQTRIEDVRGPREKVRKTANQLGREIRVKEEFQRDLRFRPICEA